MNSNVFMKLATDRFLKCEEVLAEKCAEYSTESDRLHNFKYAALLEGCKPPMALRGMLTKHIISIYDIVARHEADGTIPSKALITAKFTDAINYFLLLEALFEEERECG